MTVPSAGAAATAAIPSGMTDNLDNQKNQEEDDQHCQQGFERIVIVVPGARFGNLSGGKGHKVFTGLYNASVIIVFLEMRNHVVPDNPGSVDVWDGPFESIAHLDGYLSARIGSLGFDEDHDSVVIGLAAHTPFNADPVCIFGCGASFQVVYRHHGNLVGRGVVEGNQFPFQLVHLAGGKQAGKVVDQPLRGRFGRNGGRRKDGCQHKQQEEQVPNLRHHSRGKKFRPEAHLRRRNDRGNRS